MNAQQRYALWKKYEAIKTHAERAQRDIDRRAHGLGAARRAFRMSASAVTYAEALEHVPPRHP